MKEEDEWSEVSIEKGLTARGEESPAQRQDKKDGLMTCDLTYLLHNPSFPFTKRNMPP